MKRPTMLVGAALLALSGIVHAVVPDDCADSGQCLQDAMSAHFEEVLPLRMHPEVELIDVSVVGGRASFTAVSYVTSDHFMMTDEQLDSLKDSISRASEEWACSEQSGYTSLFIANGGTVSVNVSYIDYAPMTRTVVTQCPR